MATKLFIDQYFSPEMIEAGASLIRQLEEQNAQVCAAFWILDDKESHWKLVIISPLVESEGPLKFFKKINNIYDIAASDEKIISLHNIQLINTKSHIFKTMLDIKDTVLSNRLNSRLGTNFWDGFYFEDMYIYKLSDTNSK